MLGQYRRLTEQSPVDMKETFGWLKAENLPGLETVDHIACFHLLQTPTVTLL